ncbi:hypothetical protein D3C85_1220550 [compost metagenome]
MSNTSAELSPFKNSNEPLPNKNSEVLIAVSNASAECVLTVISSANAFCKIRKCGASSCCASKASNSSLPFKVKILIQALTSLSDEFNQNW